MQRNLIMDLGIVCAKARMARGAATVLALTAFGLATTVGALAQSATPEKPKPTAPKPAAQKPAPAKPAQAQPPAAPAQPAPTAAAQPDGQSLPIVYSPWTKVCGKDQNQPNAKEVCLIIKEARLETGQFIAGAVLIEPEGEQKKILRITLPLGMQLLQGTRMILDQGQPQNRPYVICFPNGCMSDYDADA